MKKGFVLGIGFTLSIVAIIAIAFFLGRSSVSQNKDDAVAVNGTAAQETTTADQAPVVEGGDQNGAEETMDEMNTEAVIDAVSGEDVSIKMVPAETWEEGDKKCKKIEVVLKNNTDVKKMDWTAEIEVPEGSKLSTFWNGKLSIDGTKLIAKPEDYNKEIAPGGEVNFGFIIMTDDEFVPSEAVVSAENEE